jgi:putative FmdB family regulatory protein
MPTYEFTCPDGHDFEKFFRTISGGASELPCPVCGLIATRKISAGAGLMFKGSGFYITDYGKDGKKDQNLPRTSSNGEGATAPATGSESGGGSEPKSDSKSDSKSSSDSASSGSSKSGDSKASDAKSSESKGSSESKASDSKRAAAKPAESKASAPKSSNSTE